MHSIDEFWKPYVWQKLSKFAPPMLKWWESRWLDKKYADILACPDNAKIPRHPEAGKMNGEYQTMHNGLKIQTRCYGEANRDWLAQLFLENKGVHEPSEEFAFQTLLEHLPDSATIIELGAWWSFYSMWFCSRVKNPKAFLIEPDKEHLEYGKKNFALNGYQGAFFNYFIGKDDGFWNDTQYSIMTGAQKVPTTIPQICVDSFVEQNKISFVDILHADIQGAELDMLRGAEKLIQRQGVHYFCVSTHSDELHKACLDYLQSRNYVILCEADITHCPHIDGFFVARAKSLSGPDLIPIHKLQV